MNGTNIAIGLGVFYLLSRQSASAATANPLTGAFNSLTKALTTALQPAKGTSAAAGGKPAPPAGQGAGATAGRGGDAKEGGSIQDAFGTFDNINSPDVIDAGPTGAAFQPGGIFSDPTTFAGSDAAPDLTSLPGQDAAAGNDLINSLVPTGADAVPQFDPFGGSPDVVDLTGPQVDLIAIPDSPDDVAVPDFSDFTGE